MHLCGDRRVQSDRLYAGAQIILSTATPADDALLAFTVAGGHRPTQRISVTDILSFVIGTSCLTVLVAHGW